ncbi:MAG: hypothetical protein ACOC2D_03910 [Spirochaetota bacterium]
MIARAVGMGELAIGVPAVFALSAVIVVVNLVAGVRQAVEGRGRVGRGDQRRRRRGRGSHRPARFALPDSIWWGFLRLADPGYLGDDVGARIRVLSTALTVAGYVVFLGALIAILTQWLSRTMCSLEAGTAEYGGRNHIVLVGVINRTSVIVQQLLSRPRRVRR